MKDVLQKIFLFISSLAISLLLIELGYLVYLKAVNPVAIYQPGGKVLSPNAKGDYRGGYTSLDEHALRNPLDLSDREMKFLVFGDSLAFGLGVNDDEVFTHLLNEDAKNVDIGFMNLAYPGYDTIISVGHLMDIEKFFEPYDGIIWLYYINDAKSSKYYISWKESVKPDVFWGSNQIENKIWPYLKSPTLIKHLSKSIVSRYFVDKKNINRWNNYYERCLASYKADSKTAKNEELYLNDIIEFSWKKKVPLFFVLAPATDQFEDNNFTPQTFVKNIMSQYGIPVLDLAPILKQYENIDDFYLKVDNAHWNAKGHKLVAKEIKKFLINLKSEAL